MIKKTFKWLGIGVLGVATVGGSFVAHEWYAEKPFLMRSFLDREVVKMAFESPETLTSLGFLESVGITGHNAELDNDDPAELDRMFAKLKVVDKTLNSYADEDLTESERLSKEIANYLVDAALNAEPYRFHNYPVNQLFGVQNGYPSFMEAQHRVVDVEGGEHYLSRLKEVDRKFGQVVDGLKLRESKGILPPQFVIDRVLDEMNGFVETPVKENILYTSLEKKLSEIEEISDEDKSRLLAGAEQNIKQYVHPAYQKLIDFFTDARERSNSDDGIWRLPGGDQVYANALKFFTTTDYSAEKIHNIGLSEVDRIQTEILKILEAEGFDTSQGFSHAIELMAADERFYYEDSDAGREQILKDYQTILDEIDAGMDKAFRVRPKAGMEVVRIPQFKEKTSPGAYYQGPSLDGSRPGRFFANLYDIKATPKYGMRTLAYHEGIPGHHFQIAIAMELEGLPLFRNFSPFTAYTEGWALYSEQVAWEMGYQDDPFDNIGRLQAELFRAVRLVVDTGLHHKRWTREQSIDYMKTNTGMAQSDVVSEIERYIVMPGQATSYKVGMMKMLELRTKAQNALGEQFDIRDFHDVVLKNGAVPLDVLERLIDKYISEVQAS